MLVDVTFPGGIALKELAIITNVPGFVQAHDSIKIQF